MKNTNKQLRNFLANDINFIANNYYVPIDTAIVMYTQFLYDAFDIKGDILNVYKILTYQLIYADAYKVNNYIHKKLLMPKNEIYTYNDIVNIIDYDDLIATISADPRKNKRNISYTSI